MMGASFRVLIAMAVLGCCSLPAASKAAARAGDDGSAGQAGQGPRGVHRGVQRTLKDDDLRLIALAKQVLEDPTLPRTRGSARPAADRCDQGRG